MAAPALKEPVGVDTKDTKPVDVDTKDAKDTNGAKAATGVARKSKQQKKQKTKPKVALSDGEAEAVKAAVADVKKGDGQARDDNFSWEYYFMSLAIAAALKSKDPQARVGCALRAQDNTVVAIGWNGLPAGVDEKAGTPFARENRLRVRHAEFNAILRATDYPKLRGSTLYVTHFPCQGCAPLIVASGIQNVVYMFYADESRYKASPEILDRGRVAYEPFATPDALFDVLSDYLEAYRAELTQWSGGTQHFPRSSGHLKAAHRSIPDDKQIDALVVHHKKMYLDVSADQFRFASGAILVALVAIFVILLRK